MCQLHLLSQVQGPFQISCSGGCVLAFLFVQASHIAIVSGISLLFSATRPCVAPVSHQTMYTKAFKAGLFGVHSGDYWHPNTVDGVQLVILWEWQASFRSRSDQGDNNEIVEQNEHDGQDHEEGRSWDFSCKSYNASSSSKLLSNLPSKIQHFPTLVFFLAELLPLLFWPMHCEVH